MPTFFQFSKTVKDKHPYPSPRGINIVLSTFILSKEAKCPCERRRFVKLTFLHPNRHKIRIFQERDRTSIKRKRQEGEYTYKTENTIKMKWLESKTVTRRLIRTGFSGDAEQNFRWVCSVIIKSWLTWEDVSLIFFLSGPVQFKDVTRNLIVFL